MPAPELAARFRSDLLTLAPRAGQLGVAVSGGPDSLALLLLAQAAFPGCIQAVTVDHGLRAESMLEALHVEDVCQRLGCPHSILEIAVANGPSGLQAEARAARYAALCGWAEKRGIVHLLTAHHADDQAETVLMRLRRGSGIAGLSGIRPARPEGPVILIRPLLGWTKAELVHIVAGAGIAAVEDPTNEDVRFDRAAMRRFLRENPQFEARRIVRTATACREANDALDWAAGQLAEDRMTAQGGEWRVDPTNLPRELKRRLLNRAIVAVHAAHALTPAWTGQENVEGLLAALEAGGTATLAGVMVRGGAFWHLRAAPPRRPTR